MNYYKAVFDLGRPVEVKIPEEKDILQKMQADRVSSERVERNCPASTNELYLLWCRAQCAPRTVGGSSDFKVLLSLCARVGKQGKQKG